MKFFMQKEFIRKLIISIICVILLNFCFAPNVSASSFGGEMMRLIRSFTTALADAAASAVQFAVKGEWHPAVDTKNSGQPSGSGYWIKPDKFQYPILQISPELIFANEVELLDVNFISDNSSKDYKIKLKENEGLDKLRKVIASWYVTLRTIAVVRTFISSYIYGN